MKDKKSVPLSLISKESKLNIFTSNPKYLLPEEVKKTLRKILEIVSEKKCYLVNIFLVGKRKSKQLNSQYRKINKPTDVLAFPFYHAFQREINFVSVNEYDLGDIFICYPISKEKAQVGKYSWEKEICFLFLHGLLHLLGYDHEDKESKKIMFDLQDKILEKFF